MAVAAGRRHGVTAYSKGECRCPRCRRDWRDYMRAHRSKNRRVRRGGYFRSKLSGRRWHPTLLGLQILEAAVRRTGKTEDDVIEAALRCCGHRVEFPAVTPAAAHVN